MHDSNVTNDISLMIVAECDNYHGFTEYCFRRQWQVEVQRDLLLKMQASWWPLMPLGAGATF